MIELILIHPRRGIIRSPFLGALDPETKDFQYVLQVKWGYSECVEVQGTLDSLMSAIKTAVAQSGITVIADSYGSQLKGTDKQFIAMLECFNPDNNPLFRFHRWCANLRILDIEENKLVPHTPTSHPFIERLIGTVRRELLDQTLFWNERDLQNKLNMFMEYYNEHRCHMGIEHQTPLEHSDEKRKEIISMSDYRWENHCRGLIQLPIAA